MKTSEIIEKRFQLSWQTKTRQIGQKPFVGILSAEGCSVSLTQKAVRTSVKKFCNVWGYLFENHTKQNNPNAQGSSLKVQENRLPYSI